MLYKVKVSTQDTRWMMLRQTPGNRGIWRNYQFYINEDIPDADFWVVYGKGRKTDETCLIAPQNIIFGSGEPDSVYQYATRFLKQFSVVFSSSVKLKHPGKIVSQPSLAWYIGVVFTTGKGLYAMKDEDKMIRADSDYDYFVQDISQPKKKLLSVMCSNLTITAGHQERVAFVNKLKEYYGDRIDVFGRGFYPIEDKWEALRNYKYHIALENTKAENYWTEKFADAILGDTYPIYYGCPNMQDYFSREAYTGIDICNFDEAVRIIDRVIAENKYESSKRSRYEAKRLILDKYNFFNVVADIFDHMNTEMSKKNVTIRHELSYKNWNKVAMFAKRFFYQLKNKVGK
jgi:hypothetical protein